MNALIIDDEKDARDILRQMLSVHCPHISIVGEAADGHAGLRLIRELRPGLVFLDVEMPGKNGFQLLEELSPIDFALIFVTAYDQYAVRAFEFSTVSYLLKPVDKIRLISAVLKAQETRRLQDVDEQHRLLLEILKDRQADPWQHHRMCFSNQQEVVFVALKDIIRIEANGNCSSVYTLNQSNGIFVAKNIGEYVKLFQDVPFLFQTHRGHMVNVYHAKKFVKAEGGSLMVRNHNGGADVKIPVTQERRPELFRRMEELQL